MVDLNTSLSAAARGWGPGWPHCQEGLWVPLEVQSYRGGQIVFRNHKTLQLPDGSFQYEEVDLPGGVRSELHDLIALLLRESEARGWINLVDGWCWGAACRAIKTSSGGSTDIPSNHSWGIAVDLNAPENGFGASFGEIPDEMARLWNRYGFRWGGDYSGTKDWMHFEFMGTPAEARALTQQAIADGIGVDPEQEDETVYKEFKAGWQAYRDAAKKKGSDPGDPSDKKKGADWKFGWNAARFAAGVKV